MPKLHAVSQERIEELRSRSKRCVCKYCGGALSLKRIIFSDCEDARIEIYCDSCERIEYGIEPPIYRSAQNFVDSLAFNYFADMDQNDRTRRMDVAKVCEIMAWGYKNTGLLDEQGFTVTLPPLKNHALEKCLILTDDELPPETED